MRSERWADCVAFGERSTFAIRRGVKRRCALAEEFKGKKTTQDWTRTEQKSTVCLPRTSKGRAPMGFAGFWWWRKGCHEGIPERGCGADTCREELPAA